MTSQKKIEANRRNAERSTGPRTKLGKAKSAQNARKHGLATTGSWSPAMASRVEKLTDVFAGPDATREKRDQAKKVARAHNMLELVEEAKRRCIEQHLPAQAKSKAASKERQTTRSTRAWTWAQIEAIPELFKLERYERRAFSRRNRELRILQQVT